MVEERQWICVVCGYIHKGAEPPDVCPLCCASKDQFELVPAQKDSPVTRWQCQVCGHIHEGDSPPDSCPVCGASAERYGQMRPDAL